MKIRTFFASALLICAQLISAQFLFVSVEAHASSDREAVAACLSNWGKHPFGKDLAEVKFRTISPGVKILGIGGSNLNDSAVTSSPELVLVKPSVNVLSKSTFKLLNPQGWYCLKGTTAVLGSAHFEIHCKANMASVDDNKTGVLGAADSDGVAVLGSIRVKKIDCK